MSTTHWLMLSGIVCMWIPTGINRLTHWRQYRHAMRAPIRQGFLQLPRLNWWQEPVVWFGMALFAFSLYREWSGFN